jgi:hypothetical protein
MIIGNNSSEELIETFLGEDLASDAGRIRFYQDSYTPEAVFARLKQGVKAKKIRYVHGDILSVTIIVNKNLIIAGSKRTKRIRPERIAGVIFGPTSSTF